MQGLNASSQDHVRNEKLDSSSFIEALIVLSACLGRSDLSSVAPWVTSVLAEAVLV